MAGEIAPYLDGIPIVADAATREARWPVATRPQDQRVFNKGTGNVERWSGSAWITDLYGPGGAFALSPKSFGAIGDGNLHPLSSVYATLGAAQAVYPFVTSLTQQLDWAACQLMSDTALGSGGSEHGATARLNIPMTVPAGSYQFGADTWLIRNAVSMKLEGAGRLATTFTSSGIVFATDGCWYSQFTGMTFISTGAAATVFDLDGNVPGHPYATRGVQGNTFRDIYIEGSNVAVKGLSITRQGNPPGPGAQGSENLFINCHFNDCTFANFYSNGFNALNNTFIGGNFQGHQTHGIYAIQGSFHLFSVGFQSTYGYQQIINGGYDITAIAGGVGDHLTIIACRTESLRFLNGNGSQPPLLMGCNQSAGGSVGWIAGYPYPLHMFYIATSPTRGARLYRVTTPGTSGATEPAWPDTGTVADGAVVWTQTDFSVVNATTCEIRSCDFERAADVTRSAMVDSKVKEINANYAALFDDEMILCANTVDITVTLPQFVGGATRTTGKRWIIKKALNNSAKVTITYGGGPLDGTPLSTIIPGGTQGWIQCENAGGGLTSPLSWIISKSFERVGTGLVAGDFALSAGFGTTASVAVASGSKDVRGAITVTSAGVGQAANPTITLTFKDGAFPAAPFAVVARAGGSQRTVPVEVTTVSTTQLVATFLGTPVAAETYTLSWTVTA
jgi:hypothetical protein